MKIALRFGQQIRKLLKASFEPPPCNSLELAHALEQRHEPLFVYRHWRRDAVIHRVRVKNRATRKHSLRARVSGKYKREGEKKGKNSPDTSAIRYLLERERAGNRVLDTRRRSRGGSS